MKRRVPENCSCIFFAEATFYRLSLINPSKVSQGTTGKIFTINDAITLRMMNLKRQFDHLNKFIDPAG